VASLAVLPREVPVVVDGLEPGVVDGATVAEALAWEEVAAGLAAAVVVGVEARLAAVVVAAEAHLVVVAGADATVFSQLAVTLRAFAHGCLQALSW